MKMRVLQMCNMNQSYDKSLKCKMHIFGILLLTIGCLPCVVYTANAVGLLPTPVFTDVGVQLTTNFDSNNGLYTYSYVISNPQGNTGEIWNIRIDVSTMESTTPIFSNTSGLFLDFGNTTISYDEFKNRQSLPKSPHAREVVPIGTQVPAGWAGIFGQDGYVRLARLDEGTNILPGLSMGGLNIISPGLPTLRAIEIVPDWMLVVEDHDAVTDSELSEASAIEKSLPFRTTTLGPSSVDPGSFVHWNQLRADLDKAVQLGWIPDTGLAATLVSQLASARNAIDSDDGISAKIILQSLLSILSQSNNGQRRDEAHDLLVLNVEAIIENTSDTPIPYEPALTLSPDYVELTIGNTYTLGVTLVNLANKSEPAVGKRLEFSVVDGPNFGDPQLLRLVGITDQNGQTFVNYASKKLGTDTIEILDRTNPESPKVLGTAKVKWDGGTDMVIATFTPPLIKATGSTNLIVRDITANLGTVPSPVASITRYYLSDQEIINPSAAILLGERLIDANLLPDDLTNEGSVEVTLPDNLVKGQIYYLAACADGAENISELDENNNCSFNQVSGIHSIIVPLDVELNNAPVCENARASISMLWPPNHKFVKINILGVTDPDNDSVSIHINQITQDEPVNDSGDGNTAPDAIINGDGTFQIRAERAGNGNGRVYSIAFTAEDTPGGHCSGSIQVGVPHDKGQGAVPINDANSYDSTSS